MNLEKTKEYKDIHDKLKRLLLDDLAGSLLERSINASIRHKANQRAFFEDLDAKGINYDSEKVM